jgi:hypothetical protein
MNPILAAGLLIGGLGGAFTYIMGFTGWYKDPVMINIFIPTVVIIEVSALIWGLRKTAALGRTYSGQVVAGTMMAVIGAVIVFVSSYLFTTVAFPSYFEDVNMMARQVLQGQGKTSAEIQAFLDSQAASQTPLMNAFVGFIMTIVTGVMASAVIAAFIRHRPNVLTTGV